MMLLTSAIELALTAGAITCTPTPRRIEGAHIDVTLGRHWWLFCPPDAPLNLADADPRECFTLQYSTDTVTIPPRGFVLACTDEFIGTAPGSGIVPLLHTRSTLARWGLAVCTANAGLGDEGFETRWTLEITNPHPCGVSIPVGARVGGVSFQRGEGSAVAYATGTRYNADVWTPEDMLPRRGNW